MYKEKYPLKSVCLLRLSSLGDVTHMIPIVNTIKNENPKINITWIINKTEYELVKNIKNVTWLVIYVKMRFWFVNCKLAKPNCFLINYIIV